MNDPSIEIIEGITQKELKNSVIKLRDIRLDVLCKDKEGNYYNLEVENKIERANPKRARFHMASITTRMLKQNEEFKDIKNTYVLFFTKGNVIDNEKRTNFYAYTNIETNQLLKDGTIILYFDTNKIDDTPLGKLAHDFNCANPDEMYYEPIAKAVRHYKCEGGEKEMCELVEQYGQQRKLEGINLGRQEGIDLGKQVGIDIGRQEGINLGRQEGERKARKKWKKKVKQAESKGKQDGQLKTLVSLVQQNLITIECASGQMNLSVEEFINKANELNISLIH